MTTFAVTSVGSLCCQATTCLRIGSKFLCIRSTAIEKQSTAKAGSSLYPSSILLRRTTFQFLGEWSRLGLINLYIRDGRSALGCISTEAV